MSSNITNWPPAKGPKPPHLQVTEKRIESKPPIRSEFKFRQPADAVLERAILLDTIGDPEVAKISEGVKVVHPANDYQVLESYERDFRLSHHVGSIANLSALDARKLVSGWSVRRKKFEWLLPPRATTVPITYPLSLGVKLKITPYHYVVEFADDTDLCETELSLGYVLWVIAKEYVRIYEEWKRYKIWGHELWDLWFKRLTVTKSGRAELVVES
jgi:hypothetical protein